MIKAKIDRSVVRLKYLKGKTKVLYNSENYARNLGL